MVNFPVASSERSGSIVGSNWKRPSLCLVSSCCSNNVVARETSNLRASRKRTAVAQSTGSPWPSVARLRREFTASKNRFVAWKLKKKNCKIQKHSYHRTKMYICSLSETKLCTFWQISWIFPYFITMLTRTKAKLITLNVHSNCTQFSSTSATTHQARNFFRPANFQTFKSEVHRSEIASKIQSAPEWFTGNVNNQEKRQKGCGGLQSSLHCKTQREGTIRRPSTTIPWALTMATWKTSWWKTGAGQLCSCTCIIYEVPPSRGRKCQDDGVRLKEVTAGHVRPLPVCETDVLKLLKRHRDVQRILSSVPNLQTDNKIWRKTCSATEMHAENIRAPDIRVKTKRACFDGKFMA